MAVLAVIYHHLVGVHWNAPGWLETRIAGVTLYPGALLSNGWIGVKLFFLLSGFVLFLPYAEGKREIRTKAGLWDFYRRRSMRLLPLYFLVLFACLALGPTVSSPNECFVWLLVMGSLVFPLHWRTYTPATNWVLWSLGTELYFSVFFPFVSRWILRSGAFKVWLASMVLALGVRALGVVSGIGTDVTSPYKDFFSSSVLGSLDDFVTGMLVCHLMVAKWRPKVRLSPVLITAAGFLGLYASLMYADAVTLGHVPQVFKPFLQTFINLSLLAFVGSLILWPGQFSAKCLSLRPLALVGMMCYSLYVWHGMALKKLVPGAGALTVTNIVVYALLLGGLSWVTYRYVEFGHVRNWRNLLPERAPRSKHAFLA